MYDAIVLGAGINGLAAAAYLARAGKRVVVLERRDVIGGTAAVEEFHPGFRAASCRDDIGWVPHRLQADLQLDEHGLSLHAAPVGVVAAAPGQLPIVTWPDARKTASALRAISPHDADRWAGFAGRVAAVAATLGALAGRRPPLLRSKSAGDLLALMSLGRRLRSLGRREMMEVVRALPMPIADLVEEWIEHPVLQAALAALGIRGVMHGPLSSGTAFVFFHAMVGAPMGHIGVRRFAQSAKSATMSAAPLADALAASARAAGAEIRTQADVSAVLVRNGRVSGVALAGEEIPAPLVLSSLDPRRTFGMIDAMWLDAELLTAIDNVRMRGATARVHFAVDALPAFSTDGRTWDRESLSGTMVISGSGGLMGIERAYDDAKYGNIPREPALSVVVPSLTDATLAPAGRHVVSVDVHHVPYAPRGGWNPSLSSALGDMVERRIGELAPSFSDHVAKRWVLTPADMEARYGATGGSLTQGELALDQILFMRPVPQCARYRTPVPGLWLCGAGSHPASTSGVSGMLAAKEYLREPR